MLQASIGILTLLCDSRIHFCKRHILGIMLGMPFGTCQLTSLVRIVNDYLRDFCTFVSYLWYAVR